MRLVRVLIVCASVGAAACATHGGVPRPFPGAAAPAGPEQPAVPGTVPPPTAETLPPPVVLTAMDLRGIPYRNGGSDPSGFDCSGFVQWVFNTNGVRLPREVREQYRVGEAVPLESVQAGDLLFFETVSDGASHVGLAIGDQQFVHAPSSRGVVRVERYTAAYWSMRFVGARRVATPVTETK